MIEDKMVRKVSLFLKVSVAILVGVFTSVVFLNGVISVSPVDAAKRYEGTETCIGIELPSGKECWLVGPGAEETLDLIGKIK